MTMLWTLDELIAATGGTLHGTAQGCSGINFDSRAIMPGDLFLALTGDNGADGHDYVASAIERGAALALVSRVIENAGPQLLVPDVLQALEQLAIAARRRAPAKRAAVTGSVGKTGTTRAIEAALLAAGTAHAPVGSFNNHIGVPLTLARMPRTTERAVFEIGMNHPGEITPLSQMVCPDVALITTVGAVHSEHFPDGEAGIARAKAEIFNGMQPGAVAVLNGDNQWYGLLRERALKAGLRTLCFGTHSEADARFIGSRVLDHGLEIHAAFHGETLTFSIGQHGHHWALNGLGVMLVLEEMGVPRATALTALQHFTPLAGRGAVHRLPVAQGTYQLIDESYNANPLSMAATLNYLAIQQGRKIAVLTDMLELGEAGPDCHRRIAALVEDHGIDLVFCAGPLMQHLWDALPASRRGAYAATASALVPALHQALQPGDMVLVKGSKGSKAASIVEALLAAKS